MMCVETFLASSQHGVGLFSSVCIPKGTLVWKFDPRIDRIYTVEALFDFPGILKEFMKTYAYRNIHTGEYVFCGDNARFFNHSEDSNVIAHVPNDPQKLDENYTRRDILAGEELTVNYREFDSDWDYGFSSLTPSSSPRI